MRVFASSYVFEYAWNEVSTANWRKYCPWNKSSAHVVAVDTLSRTVDPVTGVLCTERLITCTQPAPMFVTALLRGQCTTHSYEKSYVDPHEKRVKMVSTNLTWSNLITVREKVSYEPDMSTSEAAHDRTVFKQEARVTALCGGWQRMKIKIEEATIDRFKENARKGREGFETVLRMSRVVMREDTDKQFRYPIAKGDD